MKRLIVIITVICITSLSFFTGCPSGPDYYIKFRVDGMSKTFDKGFTNYESEPFSQIITNGLDYTDMWATPDVETGDMQQDTCIKILFRGTTIDTYTGKTQAYIYYVENQAEWGAAYWVVDDIIVTVAKYEDVGGVIEGTFSTTIGELVPDGPTKVITEGEFRVKRVVDNTYNPLI